jgi:hypothetical protein
MFQTKVVEEIETHILCSVTFFFNRAVYEEMRKNNVERGGSHMTIWRMRVHAEYLWLQKPVMFKNQSCCVILIAFPQQQWLHERASMLPYTYIGCLVQNKYESFILYYSLNSEFIDKLDPTYLTLSLLTQTITMTVIVSLGFWGGVIV